MGASQTYLICRLKNLTSSSVIEPTCIGAGDNISCLREATTHVGSFSRASEPRGQPTGTFVPGGRNPHVVVLDGHSLW